MRRRKRVYLKTHLLPFPSEFGGHAGRPALCKIPGIWFLGDQVGSDTLNDLKVFVLFENDCQPAFGAVVARLDTADADLKYLLSRIAMHLVVRYTQVQNPEEPEVEYHDVTTGEVDRRPMKEFHPDWYQQVLVRRQHENELFRSLDECIAIRFAVQVATIDPEIFPCDNWQLAEMARVIAVK